MTLRCSLNVACVGFSLLWITLWLVSAGETGLRTQWDLIFGVPMVICTIGAVAGYSISMASFRRRRRRYREPSRQRPVAKRSRAAALKCGVRGSAGDPLAVPIRLQKESE